MLCTHSHSLPNLKGQEAERSLVSCGSTLVGMSSGDWSNAGCGTATRHFSKRRKPACKDARLHNTMDFVISSDAGLRSRHLDLKREHARWHVHLKEKDLEDFGDCHLQFCESARRLSQRKTRHAGVNEALPRPQPGTTLRWASTLLSPMPSEVREHDPLQLAGSFLSRFRESSSSPATGGQHAEEGQYPSFAAAEGVQVPTKNRRKQVHPPEQTKLSSSENRCILQKKKAALIVVQEDLIRKSVEVGDFDRDLKRYFGRST